MNIDAFLGIIKTKSADDVTSDEPHAGMRCDENNITLNWVKDRLLDTTVPPIRIVEDRPSVYKIYYRLSKHRELKIIIDMLTVGTINIRTVKILRSEFRLGNIRRPRF